MAVAVAETIEDISGEKTNIKWVNDIYISDKKVYMYYEAGFGDVIQYARYFPLLKERCAKLLFKPQQELLPLLRENPLGVDNFVTFEDEDIDFDVYVPMFSLPYLLGLDEENMFIARDGYIKSNSVKKEAARLLNSKDISYIDWNVLTGDAEGAITKESILKNIGKNIKNKGNIVVLMHDSSSKILTYETLKDVIDYLRSQGYTFDNFYSIMQ